MNNNLETSQVIVFLLNKDLQIKNVSENVLQILGYKAEELYEKKIVDIYFSEDRLKIKSKLESIIKNETNYQSWELKKQRKDGGTVWTQEFIQTIKNENNIAEIKLFCIDITEQRKIQEKLNGLEKENISLVDPYRDEIDVHLCEIRRKQFEEELLEAKLKAEESDKLKSQFLAQISHEIRSPIHTILSFSSLIYNDIKDEISDQEKSNFRIINSAGKRITRTIDLILNMSEIQTGTYDCRPRKLDIYSEILTSLIDEAKITSGSNDIEFKVNKTSQDTIRVVDAYSITQIFINLLENAFKYTKAGYVELGIQSNNKNELEISVTDTGIGIAKEYIPKLFKPFSQEEQGYTRTFEGNGLGLALVKNYCDMNNAKIKVESNKGVGTTFSVTFRNN